MTATAPQADAATVRAPATAPVAAPGADMGAMQATIDQLLDEVRALRRRVQEQDALADLVGQLRDANENLVLATVTAQTLRDEAEATNRRQNEFLAMLAHELRNPLAPISMAATLLEKVPNATEHLLKLQQVVSRQVAHMSRLLDDLLDAARLSSGKISLQRRAVLLAEIVEQAVETVQPRADARRQVLTIDLPPQPVVIDGDPVRLAQVLSNLLGNASKFTPDQGHLTLEATVRDGQVVLQVRDDGIGIAPEVMPHIFDLFTQGPRSLARSEGGLGVGLNVVRNLVQLHGGSVAVDSAGSGRGSVFTVTLPVSDATQAHDGDTPASSGATPGRRILLIEDNVDASDTMKAFLSLEGHQVATAFDGPTGLRMAREADWDVVLCDIGLPGLNGFDVISELRRHLPDGRLPCSIALSGYGQLDDRTRASDAGFDHFFVKPIESAALLSVIATSTAGVAPAASV